MTKANKKLARRLLLVLKLLIALHRLGATDTVPVRPASAITVEG